MKRQVITVDPDAHSAVTAGRRLPRKQLRKVDSAHCWCGARKVQHVIAGQATKAYECPYHFMPDHEPGATRGRLFLDQPTDR